MRTKTHNQKPMRALIIPRNNYGIVRREANQRKKIEKRLYTLLTHKGKTSSVKQNVNVNRKRITSKQPSCQAQGKKSLHLKQTQKFRCTVFVHRQCIRKRKNTELKTKDKHLNMKMTWHGITFAWRFASSTSVHKRLLN